MPEGHTIHRAARIQRGLLAGGAVRVDSPQGRFAHGAALLDGRELLAIDAYGKHLFYAFAGDVWVHVHLGLFGKFRTGTGEPPPPRGAVRMRVSGERGWMTLSGPTACDLVDDNERRLILDRIGPDPLREDARPAAAIARIMRSAAPIGVLLMDQRVVAGIGNVYRAELLFRARISPAAPGRSLARAQILALWKDARMLLRDGEERGRIVTTRPADRPHPRGAVRRGEQYYVYHRTGQPCRICGSTIERAAMAARTLYFCPVCQSEPSRPSSRTIAGMRARSPKKPRVAKGHVTAS
ncbi:endonuclease VIII [Vulcanimicrobium alpinum]|uniref:DNA-(apurinic or apyrimidinic site) lyase n=1 Tax=Vulcanimicrobium alpinum TaxID=3016050 RepID=A0AAN1XWI1_UNVUL|nr:DNA-formamidopyrimidine glycosylase family protein [Vulcanimicrobium alpinum]BDE05826.1 endonuclease VIII [Vulcanimicrobium alpinum]